MCESFAKPKLSDSFLDGNLSDFSRSRSQNKYHLLSQSFSPTTKFPPFFYIIKHIYLRGGREWAGLCVTLFTDYTFLAPKTQFAGAGSATSTGPHFLLWLHQILVGGFLTSSSYWLSLKFRTSFIKKNSQITLRYINKNELFCSRSWMIENSPYKGVTFCPDFIKYSFQSETDNYADRIHSD